MKTINTPLTIIAVYSLIALLLFYITRSINVFSAIIGTGISVLLLITAIQQNGIQKDNIKLQMFDKRYAVFEAITNSIAIVKQKDYSDLILSGETEYYAINKLIKNADSNLEKQRLLSQALFEDEIYVKIRNISNEFSNITKLHFKLYKQNLKLKQSNPLLFNEFSVLFNNTIYATTNEEVAQCNNILQEKFPDIHRTITEFNSAAASYSDFIKETGVMTDFDKYLIIHNLDK